MPKNRNPSRHVDAKAQPGKQEVIFGFMLRNFAGETPESELEHSQPE